MGVPEAPCLNKLQLQWSLPLILEVLEEGRLDSSQAEQCFITSVLMLCVPRIFKIIIGPTQGACFPQLQGEDLQSVNIY